MFDNIGKKIKTLAKVVCWAGITASVILGFTTISSIPNEALGFLMLVLIAGLGSLFSWVGSFALYGFGELIDNSAIIAEFAEKGKYFNEEVAEESENEYDEFEDGDDGFEMQASGDEILNNLLDNGFITKSEYDLLIQKERKN